MAPTERARRRCPGSGRAALPRRWRTPLGERTSLERAECPVCHRSLAPRADGRVRKHVVPAQGGRIRLVTQK
ncbi:hypothetical protein I5G61_gp87 [Mycobacterium phage Quesadilla]|uniref:Uncharacterized protein n=1 Tax=Mycobacterium phage Quesadilla TaxID=2664226 RepID=A0A5Q2WFN7_9CAUD|nr:hypothetical protein I5G61_gp87 [Mycobacterium phage Quesadilla]QGH75335.1 hypothetical protein SEA_QUESADILLA_87 [Mycobacterium phage Quesadilla]